MNRARIALLEARMSGEMAELVRRNAGEPYGVPAVREVPLESRAEVSAFIDRLVSSQIDTVVFFTGVGVSALMREAEQLQRLPELLTALRAVRVVCRGPKPSAVLKKYEVPIALTAREPYTTNELLEVMEPLDLCEAQVAVVHYGERNEAFAQALSERGAHLDELCLYEWQLPADLQPLQALVREIIAGQVDAVVFTSQIQARHLFQVAEELGLRAQLSDALHTKTVVASVGPTCTAVLRTLNVEPHVEPEHPKMGHLVKALAQYLAANGRTR